jgi:long-chain acyl-CoA synthetase
VTTAETARADTFAKLMLQHAAVRGGRPAFRHKDHGIWQTWTWAEVGETVRAYAVGLSRLGLRRGERIAIVGGGIGLLLTQAMITQKDWEEVTYYIVLIVLVVMAMDSFSGWIRRRLIRG